MTARLDVWMPRPDVSAVYSTTVAAPGSALIRWAILRHVRRLAERATTPETAPLRTD